MNSKQIIMVSVATVVAAAASAVSVALYVNYRTSSNRSSQDSDVKRNFSPQSPFDLSKRKGYLSWDDYLMAIAFLSAERSNDPNRQVGACLELIIMDSPVVVQLTSFHGLRFDISDSMFTSFTTTEALCHDVSLQRVCKDNYSDDIVLIDETKEGVNQKLERWREALESKCFKISRSKTEYLACTFGTEARRNGSPIEIEDREVSECTTFRYLGSIIQKTGDIREDIDHRIKVEWLNWRMTSGVLCDKRMPARLKEKCYKTMVRPVMLYGSECWATTRIHMHMQVAEMRMLRWMRGKTRKDKINNERFRSYLGVTLIEDKIRERRLTLFLACEEETKHGVDSKYPRLAGQWRK